MYRKYSGWFLFIIGCLASLNNLIEAAKAVEATLLAKGAVAADILSQTDQQGMVFIE